MPKILDPELIETIKRDGTIWGIAVGAALDSLSESLDDEIDLVDIRQLIARLENAGKTIS